jgi:hypothetical protein
MDLLIRHDVSYKCMYVEQDVCWNKLTIALNVPIFNIKNRYYHIEYREFVYYQAYENKNNIFQTKIGEHFALRLTVTKMK